MNKYLIALVALALFQTGCLSQLKTRSDVQAEAGGGGRAGAPKSQAPQTPTETPVDSVVVDSAPTPKYKSEEKDEQVRNLYGRVEEAENKVQELSQSISQLDESRRVEREQHEAKLALYEEAIKKMEAEIQAMKAAKEVPPAPSSPSKGAKDSNANLREDFYRGEDSFKRGNWKDAIVFYQKYRESFPKGKFYPDATYKIGLCFVELGLKDESRSFFEEVKTKFPKSPLAKKASEKLKSR